MTNHLGLIGIRTCGHTPMGMSVIRLGTQYLRLIAIKLFSSDIGLGTNAPTK